MTSKPINYVSLRKASLQILRLSRSAILLTSSALLLTACVSQQSSLDLAPQDLTNVQATELSLQSPDSIANTDPNAVAVSHENVSSQNLIGGIAVPVQAPRTQTTTNTVGTAPQSQTDTASAVTAPTAAATNALAVAAPTPEPNNAIAQNAVIAAAVTQPTDSSAAIAAPPATTQAEVPTQVAALDPNATIRSAATQPAIVATPQPVRNRTVTRRSRGDDGTIQTSRRSSSTSGITSSNSSSENAGSRNLFSIFQKKPEPPRPARTVGRSDKPIRNASASALPGVKSNAELFGIKEETNNSAERTQLASVGGLGRLSPNGLRLQHDKVQVSCLKPGVLKILKIVERRYKSQPIVTSGYRSPKGNRRAGGARNSQHIFCKAVDIQVEGVSKWDLAKFLRSIPGRGGVGTYCRTKSVHIDIGSKRDWHYPCRRSTVKKRKKA